LLKEVIDFLPPRRQEPLFSQQRLRVLLKPTGIAGRDPGGAGLGLDTRNPGDSLLQIRSRQGREVIEQRALIPLLGREQRRPFLKLHEDERVHGRRETREHLSMRPRERRGVSGQSCVELHHSATRSESQL
jgi:hypothetical protein